jgi:hypothetical protein
VAKRVAARGRTAIVMAVVLLVGSYLINGWFTSRGWHPLIHMGGRGRGAWVGQCSTMGLNLWVPCWVTVVVPLALIAVALGMFRDVD